MTGFPLRNVFLTCAVCLLLAGPGVLRAETSRQQAIRELQPGEVATPGKIVQYVRDRFALPDSVIVTASPLDNSPFPGFFATTVTTDDGKQKRANNVLISRDGHCFVLGNVFALNQGSPAELLRCIREATKLPPQTELKLDDFAKTPYPQFLKSVMTANDGKKTQTANVFITKDKRTGILGFVVPFREDFVQGLIRTEGFPSKGPGNAPVTIVEYADLQCPMCARLHDFLERVLLPKYGDKVRIVFKEFLIPGHDWSATAAVANECADETNPSAFFAYRTLIFANQNAITASNAREILLNLGDEAGVDRSKLGACLDSKATMSRVDAARQEGQDLGIERTPTSFVNGRIVVGLPSEADFDKIVADALSAVQQSKPAKK